MFVFGAVTVLMVGCQPFRWVVSATKRCRGSLASFRSIVSERRLEVLCNWCFFPKLWFFFMDLLNWRILFPTKVTFITDFRSRNLNHWFTYNKATEIAANSNNVPSRAILSWLFVQCVTIQGKIQAYINDFFDAGHYLYTWQCHIELQSKLCGSDLSHEIPIYHDLKWFVSFLTEKKYQAKDNEISVIRICFCEVFFSCSPMWYEFKLKLNICVWVIGSMTS